MECLLIVYCSAKILSGIKAPSARLTGVECRLLVVLDLQRYN